MTTWRERECTVCKQVLLTASRSAICLTCKCKVKSQDAITKEIDTMVDYGYEVIGDPTKNSFGKRVYTLRAPCCGQTFETVYGNLISGIKKNEASGHDKLPCGNCGPKHRMALAMVKYMDKNRRQYDVTKMTGYVREVRALSEDVYNKNLAKINPKGYKRGLAGVEGAYHLDHKIPIIECFKAGWTPEQAADLSNLQILKWEENLAKGSSLLAEELVI